MKKEFVPTRLDVRALAQAGATLSGQEPLALYERLAADALGPVEGVLVDWSARGELRTAPGAAPEIWLHLQASTPLPLTCQRCMGPMQALVEADRAFRFVADEATAAALDDELDEDVLVLDPDFNLRELIEDELLMAEPLVPRHEVCPVEVPLASSDDDFEAATAEKPNPFAALAQLRVAKGD